MIDAKTLAEAGPWAVALVLSIFLGIMVRGDLMPKSVVDRIISETVTHVLEKLENAISKHDAVSDQAHEAILTEVRNGNARKKL